MRTGVGRPPSVVGILISAGGLAGVLGAVLAFVAPALGVVWPAGELVRLGGLVTILVGAALVDAGLGVLVFRPVLAGPQAAAAGFGSHRVVLTTTAFATLLAVLVGNVLPLLVLSLSGQRDLRNLPGFLAAALSVSGTLLLVAYLRFIRPGVVALRDFGFTSNRLASALGLNVWLAHLASGLGGGLLVVLLSGSVQALLRQFGIQQTQLQDYTWVRQLAPGGFWLVWLAGAVVAPLSEEIFFRGLVFRSYSLAKGPPVAYLTSAVVFGLLHLNWQAFLPIVVLGLVLAWLYRSTGSLVPGVVAHGMNNGLAFLVLYFAPQAALPGAN